MKDKGWEQMRQILEREMPVNDKKIFPLPFWFRSSAVGVLLLLGLAWWWIAPDPGSFLPGSNHESFVGITSSDESSTIGNSETMGAFDRIDNLRAELPSGREAIALENNNSPMAENPIFYSRGEEKQIFSSQKSELESLNNNQPLEIIPFASEMDHDLLEYLLISEYGVSEKASGHYIESLNKRADKSIFTQDNLPLNKPEFVKLSALSLKPAEIQYGEVEKKSERNEFNLPCYSGWILGLQYLNHTNHNLHGIGFTAGWRQNTNRLNFWVNSGLSRYFSVKSAEISDAIFQESWDVSGGQVEQFERTLLYRNADEILGSYWDLQLKVEVGYQLFDQFSATAGLQMAYNFGLKFNEASLRNRDLNSFTEVIPIGYFEENKRKLIYPLYTSASLGLHYDFSCRLSAGFRFHRNLTDFWKSELTKDGQKGQHYSLGIQFRL